MKKRRLLLLSTAVIFAVGAFSANKTSAQQPTIGSGDWYYQIGGASPLLPSPNVSAFALDIPGSAGLQLGRSCGATEPTTAISNYLGQVSDGVDQLDDLFVLAATEAIAALPALILQRANPGLYEHFQGALSQAQEFYDRAVISCEKIVEDVNAGQNPFEDWVNISKRENYKEKINEDDADAIAADEEVDEENGNKGLGWVGGEKRGGLNQEPVEINRDVATAGYNAIVNQPLLSDTAPPPNAGLRLTELFATPAEAGDFAVEVLGDKTIVTCDDCTPSSTVGVGLTPANARDNQIINEQLTLLASNATPASLDQLQEVSAANVVVTPQLLETLRSVEDLQDRALLVGRLASDIASARTVERALSLRRMLYSGRNVPEVAANALAQDEISISLVELEREIESFLFEARIQKELVSNTASVILQEGDRLATEASGIQDGTSPSQGGFLRRGEIQ